MVQSQASTDICFGTERIVLSPYPVLQLHSLPRISDADSAMCIEKVEWDKEDQGRRERSHGSQGTEGRGG